MWRYVLGDTPTRLAYIVGRISCLEELDWEVRNSTCTDGGHPETLGANGDIPLFRYHCETFATLHILNSP